MSWLDNPVFILSVGKTGTTLLVALFDGHEEMVVIPEETDYFCAARNPINIVISNPLISKKEKVERVYKHLVLNTHLHLFQGHKREKSFAQGNYDYSKFNYEIFEKEVKEFLQNNKLNLGNIFKSVPRAISIAQGSDDSKLKLWLEKTPFHIHNVINKVDELEEAFPKAKFIHIYREPIDTFISYYKKDQLKWSNYKFIYDFKRNVEITRKHIHKNNHYLIRYEDIVCKTHDSLSKLVNFMGIEYNENLLVPTKSGIAWEGNSVEKSRFTGISQSSLNKHVKFEDKSKLVELEHYLKDEIEYLGYDVHYWTDEHHEGYLNYFKERTKTDRNASLKNKLYHFTRNLV